MADTADTDNIGASLIHIYPTKHTIKLQLSGIRPDTSMISVQIPDN